ncbi:MAG: DUF86 domain-containing protein [Armatimonadota bacterium]
MKSDDVFLRHILEEIKFLTKQTREISFDEFTKDEVLKRASTRSIEIIGEAVKNLSDDFKNKIKGDAHWRRIAGMRDKLIHHYFGVNWDIVWSVIKDKLPQLKKDIEDILK